MSEQTLVVQPDRPVHLAGADLGPVCGDETEGAYVARPWSFDRIVAEQRCTDCSEWRHA